MSTLQSLGLATGLASLAGTGFTGCTETHEPPTGEGTSYGSLAAVQEAHEEIIAYPEYRACIEDGSLYVNVGDSAAVVAGCLRWEPDAFTITYDDVQASVLGGESFPVAGGVNLEANPFLYDAGDLQFIGAGYGWYDFGLGETGDDVYLDARSYSSGATWDFAIHKLDDGEILASGELW